MAAWHKLIDNVFSIVKTLRPRWWAIEDVIQVEKHLTPPVMCGFDYEVRRIESRDYGPQDRLRTFFGKFPPLASRASTASLKACCDPAPIWSIPH